jgi:hypothetical protein
MSDIAFLGTRLGPKGGAGTGRTGHVHRRRGKLRRLVLNAGTLIARRRRVKYVSALMTLLEHGFDQPLKMARPIRNGKVDIKLIRKIGVARCLLYDKPPIRL